jgi:hypothetical protein
MPAALDKLERQGVIDSEAKKKLSKARGATIHDEDDQPKVIYVKEPDAVKHELLHFLIDRTGQRDKNYPEAIEREIKSIAEPHGVVGALETLLQRRGYKKEDSHEEILPWMDDMHRAPTKQFKEILEGRKEEKDWHQRAGEALAAVRDRLSRADLEQLEREHNPRRRRR